MPKLRMSERERRGLVIKKAVARSMVDMGLKYQRDVASAIGIGERRYNSIVASGYTNMRYDEFCKIASLGMTGKEVCEAVGRPYLEQTI